MSNLIKSNNGNERRSGGLAGSLVKTGSAVTTTRAPVATPDLEFYKQNLQGGMIGFIIDATASRGSTWEEAKSIQKQMLAKVGSDNIKVKVVSFRGVNNPEDSGWQDQATSLINRMNDIDCIGGTTQINPSLDIYMDDPKKPKIVVLIGDAFEENMETALQKSRAMKEKGIKLFAFQEGTDTTAKEAFQKMAEITGGAYARFGDMKLLNGLCESVKTYAIDGEQGLKKLAQSSQAAKQIASSMKLLGPGN